MKLTTPPLVNRYGYIVRGNICANIDLGNIRGIIVLVGTI